MRKRILHLISVLFLLPLGGCYQEIPVEVPEDRKKEPSVISFEGVRAFCDNEEGLLLFHIPSDNLETFMVIPGSDLYDRVRFEGKELKLGERQDLGPVQTRRSYVLLGEKGEKRDSFRLWFSTLPLIQLFPEEEIRDEPKVNAWMEMQYYPEESPDPGSPVMFYSWTGIEFRGTSASRFDKKCFGLELRSDRYNNDRVAPLLGMRYDEDWILDAMVIDGLKSRNKLSYDLWNDIAAFPEECGVDDLLPGAQDKHVEVFLGDHYWGIYCLGERIDKSLLEFSGNQDEKGGVIYKTYSWADGSTEMKSYHSEPPQSYLWDGWELLYPEDTYYWDPLAELRKLVVQKSDAEFRSRIGELVDYDNIRDYFLLINLLLAYDNVGKNMYYVRYRKDSPLLILPWDLEASWGIDWQANKVGYYGFPGTGLFFRLIDLNVDGFRDSLEIRWEELREKQFHADSIKNLFEAQFQILQNSGALERDRDRWQTGEDHSQELLYFNSWVDERLKYLDAHIDQL